MTAVITDPCRRPLRRRLAVIAAAVLAALGVASVAAASIPDSSGVIHGCRKNSDGSVRVIDSDLGQTCATGWTALNWSQTGPQGPAGGTGPQGPAGVSGLEVVANSFQVTSAFDTVASVSATCPTGKVAIAGGSDSAIPSGRSETDYVLKSSKPDGPPSVTNRWNVTYVFPANSAGFQVYAYAICASAGS